MSTIANLKLDCRQTRDTINALGDFLLERRDLHRAHAALLKDDIDRARARVGEIERALERRPEIGLLAPIGSAADGLAASLTSTRAERPLGLFAGGAVRLPVFSGLVAAAGSGPTYGLAARIRLTEEAPLRSVGRAVDTVGEVMGNGQDSVRRSAENGVRIEILTLAEVITILARAYFNHVKARGAAPPVAAVIAALEKTEREDVINASQSGLSSHHVRAIRSYLEHRFHDHPRLTALAAAGYWDAFAALAPRVSMEGRRRLAALLWGDLGDFDVVYGELAAALERLNHATDIMCPPDAVRSPPASGAGWGEAHPFSILSAATVLSDADAAGELLEVRTRFGQPVAVPRNLLAILTREVTLTLDSDATSLLAGADLVQFPVACPQVVPREASGAVAAVAAADEAPWLARALVQAKTLYLAETAVARQDLTGLVLHLDEQRSLPAPFATVIADWIERSHGPTPESREATDTTLFVAVDANAARSPLAPLEAFLGTTHLGGWLERWSGDRAFDNVFLLAHERRPEAHRLAGAATPRLSDPNAAAAGTALARRDLFGEDETQRWLRHLRDAAVAVDEALHAGDGGVAYLGQSIAAVDYVRARRLQLALSLTALRRDLSDTVDRLLYASAPDAENDWRHRAALTAQARLRGVAAEQKLGHLVAALSPSDRECSWLFERLGSRTSLDDDGLMRRLSNLDDQEGPGAQRLAVRFAERVMAHWAVSMRQQCLAANSHPVLGLSREALATLVEELVVAAVRCGVGERIAAGVTRALGHADTGGPHLARAAAVAAKVAADVIGAFVSQLGFDEPWSTRHPRRRGTLGAPLFERAAAVTAADLATMQASRIVLQYHADWIEGFGLMTEENVAQSRGMRFEESEFRELAELRALLGVHSRDRAA